MENRTERKFYPPNEKSRHWRVPQSTNQSQPNLYDQNLNFGKKNIYKINTKTYSFEKKTHLDVVGYGE